MFPCTQGLLHTRAHSPHSYRFGVHLAWKFEAKFFITKLLERTSHRSFCPFTASLLTVRTGFKLMKPLESPSAASFSHGVERKCEGGREGVKGGRRYSVMQRGAEEARYRLSGCGFWFHMSFALAQWAKGHVVSAPVSWNLFKTQRVIILPVSSPSPEEP